jgi:hypothetical protein
MKSYPNQPLEIVNISSITSIKKLKLDSKYYYLEINFKLINSSKIKLYPLNKHFYIYFYHFFFRCLFS